MRKTTLKEIIEATTRVPTEGPKILRAQAALKLLGEHCSKATIKFWNEQSQQYENEVILK
jgi:hypothetical protein